MLRMRREKRTRKGTTTVVEDVRGRGSTRSS